MDTQNQMPGQQNPMATPTVQAQPAAQSGSPFKIITNTPGQTPFATPSTGAKSSGMMKVIIALVVLLAIGSGAFYAYEKLGTNSDTPATTPVADTQLPADTNSTTPSSDTSATTPSTDGSTTINTTATSDTSTTTDTTTSTDTTSTTSTQDTTTSTDTTPHKIPRPKN